MKTIQNASIRHKIRRMILLTSGLALLVTGAVVIARDLIGEPAEIKDSLSVIAEMTGSNIASALVFNDAKTAGETLSALKAEPQIQHAFLFRVDGGVFAAYCKHSGQCPEDGALSSAAWQWVKSASGKSSGTICEFKGASLYVRYPVLSHGELVGVMFLQADMTDLFMRLMILVLTVVSGLCFSLGAAYVLSLRLQRLITDPVFHLKEKMLQVTRQADYATRADSFYADEIGELIQGFNAMIEMIQTWDQDLRQHGERLELEVAHRTAELVAANAALNRTVADLRVSRDAAEASSLAKSQFLANMSHEIRTPMNGVLGMTELLLLTDLSEKQRKIAETVLQSGTLLLSVLNDILDYSKIEAGKLELVSADFDICACVEDVVHLFADSAHRKGIELACQISDAVPRALHGDCGRLRQILTNLVGNAIKFTERGEVLVRVTAFDHGLLSFEIRDTGIGIAPQAQEHIFDAFSQADGSSTRRYGGTGLGLAISKQLIELMGGEIAVESKAGSGSSFRFTLRMMAPVQPKQPSTVRHLDLRNTPDIASVKSAENSDLVKPRVFFGARVLLAEDNSLNQKLVMEMLKLLGCHVQVASNGQEALDALAVSMFDLILMDCQMPVMDGYEATHLIREKEARESTDLPGQGQATRRMPIIALTANAMQGDRERCLGAGMDDYLSKPFKLDGLSTLLKRWLPLKWKTGLSISADAGGDTVRKDSENRDSVRDLPLHQHTLGGPDASKINFLDRLLLLESIDREAWESLRSLKSEGQPSMLQKTMRRYLENTPDLIETLCQAITSGDASTMKAVAHSLLSANGFLGAKRLIELCNEFQNLGETGAVEAAVPLLPVLQAEYEKVREAFFEELGKTEATEITNQKLPGLHRLRQDTQD